jgi:pimeloyl-ACP methyl ester carboxylesterase
MGQFVEFSRSEKLGYEATLAAARADNNEQAVKDLQSIAPFPDAQHPERNLKNLGTERRWLANYGGYYWRNGVGHNSELAQFSPDYSAAELHGRDEAQWFSDQALWDEIGHIDFTKQTQFKCPVVIMQGRHDLGTSSILVNDWFKTVRAPVKKLIWFEDSAHMVYEEEPGKLLNSLVNEALPFASKR